MPKEPRILVDDLDAAPRLKAREIESSNFRRPADPINPVQGDSSLGQVTAALSVFNRNLENFNQIYMQKSNMDARDAGLVDFYQNPDKYRTAAKGSVADMVKNGVLDPSQNPYRATTVLELTGQDLAEGSYRSKLAETLKDTGDMTADQVEAHVGKIRQEFQKGSVGDSFYTNLGFSKRVGAVEEAFKSSALELRMGRQDAKAQQVLQSTTTRKFDEMLAGNLNDDAYVGMKVDQIRDIMKEAQLGTLSKNPNSVFLEGFQGWVAANMQDHPEAVKRIVDVVFETDPRGDGNKLKHLEAAKYGQIQDYVDSHYDEGLSRAYHRGQLLTNMAESEARKDIRTIMSDMLEKSGKDQLDPNDKAQLLDMLKTKPYYNEETKGTIVSMAVGPEGIANQTWALGSLNKSDGDVSRYEQATRDPYTASRALEDLRTNFDLGKISLKDFRSLEPRLIDAEKNQRLTDRVEAFEFNKNALVQLIEAKLPSENLTPEELKRKADLLDEAQRTYRSAVSQQITSERSQNPNEQTDGFEGRIKTSNLYADQRTNVEKIITTRINSEAERMNKRREAEKAMASGETPGSAPGFFSKIFHSSERLRNDFHDAAVNMSAYLNKNPGVDRPEYREKIKEYALEVKKYGERELQQQGKVVASGGMYVTQRESGGVEPMSLRGLASRANQIVGNQPLPTPKPVFVPLDPKKLQEARVSFLHTSHQVGTSWTNFIDTQTGKSRENVRLYGVTVDPKTDINGLLMPMFSSREEFNDVFSKPELAQNLATSLGVDLNEFKVNQAMRLLERGQ